MGKHRKGRITFEPGDKGPPSADDARLMDIQQGGLCFYCGQPLGAHSATYDHLIPLSHGGADVTGNVVLAHRRCNMLKGDRLPLPDTVERLMRLRKGSRLGIWPPLLKLGNDG